jgi:hypothetical protein
MTGYNSKLYEKMDETITIRNVEFNISPDFPDTYFGPGKYPTLLNKYKIKLVRIN